jgi:hypothetical protein
VAQPSARFQLLTRSTCTATIRYISHGKWSPPSDQNIHQFLQRADGRGGFAVIETDNLAGLALGHMKFPPWLEFAVYPVLDYQEAVGLLAEAAEFRKSIT